MTTAEARITNKQQMAASFAKEISGRIAETEKAEDMKAVAGLCATLAADVARLAELLAVVENF
jgi:hypothetical protein